MSKHVTALMGAALSDLTAHVFALGTEVETGVLLDQRIKEIRAFAETIIMHAESVAKFRRHGCSSGKCVECNAAHRPRKETQASREEGMSLLAEEFFTEKPVLP